MLSRVIKLAEPTATAAAVLGSHALENPRLVRSFEDEENKLTEMFSDGQVAPAGELSLQGIDGTTVECDLLIDQAWQGALEFRYFGGAGAGTANPIGA